MKKLFVLLSGLMLAGSVDAQHAAEYAAQKLEAKSDYNESANGLAKTAFRSQGYARILPPLMMRWLRFF